MRSELNCNELPIRFINDATAFAIGEYFSGKLKGVQRTLSVTLGTGLGSAFLFNGIPVITEDSVPENGCLWHLPFESGIADDYFSTRGLVRRFEALSGIKANGVKEIAELTSENQLARQLFVDFGEKLAEFLAPWLKSFEVEALVFGGNISKALDLFITPMKSRLEREGIETGIESSDLQETAAFIGSACLMNTDFWNMVQPQLKYM